MTVENFGLERVKQTKFLGVIINEKLYTWDNHILLMSNVNINILNDDV